MTRFHFPFGRTALAAICLWTCFCRTCHSQVASDGFPTEDCGTAHGCIGFPEDTCLANGRCTMLLKFSFDPAVRDKVPVELYGTQPSYRSQNFWIAVGFNSEPQKMAGALVTECVYNNGAAGVFSSRNLPNVYANQRILLTGVAPGNGSLHNGILGCSFVLNRERKVNDMIYDLAQPFFVIAGSGPAMGSTTRQHFQRPSVSSDAIVIAPLDNSVVIPIQPTGSSTFVTDSPQTLITTTARTVLFEKFVQSQFPFPLPPPSTKSLKAETSGNDIRAPGRAWQAVTSPGFSVPPLHTNGIFGSSQTTNPNNVFNSVVIQDQQQKTQGSSIFTDSFFPPQMQQNSGLSLGPSVDGMPKLINEETVAKMVMKFLEPPLKMLVDILNRGSQLRNGYRATEFTIPTNFKQSA